MTDARFPERLLNDRRLLRLDEASFRSYVMAMIWSVSNRTDGCLMPDELPLIPLFAMGSVTALVDGGLWSKLGAGFVIEDFEATQTSKADLEILENARKRDRDKKRRQRAAKRVPGDTQEGVSFRSLSRGTGAGTAQERQGLDDEAGSEWPVAEIGKGRKAS